MPGKESGVYKSPLKSDKSYKKMEKIGRAAARVFHKIGYLEANLDHITAAAKLSKGGVYHYFSSKEEILFFILDEQMDVVLEGLEVQLKEIPSATAKIEFIVKRHVEIYAKHQAASKTLLHDSHCLSTKYNKQIVSKEREYLRIVSGAISEYFGADASVNNHEITALTFLLFGMCNWCYHWYDPKGPIDTDALSQMILMVFIKGVSELQKGGDTEELE